MHLRYEFTPWFDVRLAYRNPSPRPDYFKPVPFERINFAEQNAAGEPPSAHQSAEPRCLCLLYSNDLGLFTFGVLQTAADIDLHPARLVWSADSSMPSS